MNAAAVIPIAANDKRPLVSWAEFQRRLPTDDEVRDWRRRFSGCNWGLVTGAVSKLIVLDVDKKRNGQAALRGKNLPPTRTIGTPHAGWHYYFLYPGFPVPCIPDILPGVDLKGDAGYAVCPPSAINGVKYEVLVDEPPGEAPAWLLELIRRHQQGPNGQARLEPTELTYLLRGVPEGAREKTATRLAGRYLAKGLPVGEVRELLLAWNLRNPAPLDPAEIDKCVRSIARTDLRKRTEQSPIAFINAATLTAQTVRWVWVGRIALKTFTVLAGPPGLGKSTILTELVARLSRGQLDGDLYGDCLSSIFATAEDSLTSTVVPRLIVAGADLNRVHLPTERTLLLPDHLDALASWQARVGAKVIILDPLVAHLSSRVNSWRDQDIRRVLAPAVRWAEDADIALVSVVHLNKSDSTDIFSRIGGSIGIGAAARNILLAAPDPQASDRRGRILAHPKHNLGLEAPALRYQIESRTLEIDGKPTSIPGIAWLGEAANVTPEELLATPDVAERTERDDATAWLKETLRDGPQDAKVVYKEGERLGFSQRTLYRAKQAGGVRALKHAGKWTWALP
jgi:hypothetical protein